MHYFGGKYRIAKELANFINKYTTGKGYYEPFVGGANVTQHIKANKVFASDAHPQLIALWQELQKGWIPPEKVTERESTTKSKLRYYLHIWQALLGSAVVTQENGLAGIVETTPVEIMLRMPETQY